MGSRITRLNSQELADVLEVTKVQHTEDLGIAMVHRGEHPKYGAIAIVATAGEHHALLT